MLWGSDGGGTYEGAEENACQLCEEGKRGGREDCIRKDGGQDDGHRKFPHPILIKLIKIMNESSMRIH